MSKLGKDFLGKGFDIKTEVTNGQCPVCETTTVFVSLYKNFYRCMNCGGNTEQKVNGVISYIPLTTAGGKTPTLTLSDDNG